MIQKAIVVDDVEVIRKSIVGYIKKLAPFIDVVAEAASVKEAFEKINAAQPQILFLDVELTDGTSFDLLSKLNYSNYKIVFITAHDHFAVKAFKYSAIDYIVKPIDEDDFKSALNKLEKESSLFNSSQSIENLLQNVLNAKNNSAQKVILKTADSIYAVSLSDIVRCQADNNYTTFYLQNGKKIMVSVTLKEYEDLFKNNHFFRISQSHLINLNYFDRYERQDGGVVIMKDNSNLPLSVKKKEAFMAALKGFN